MLCVGIWLKLWIGRNIPEDPLFLHTILCVTGEYLRGNLLNALCSGYTIVIRRNKRIVVTPTLLYFHALNNHQLRTSIRHRIEENHQISRIIVSPENTTKSISYTLTRCKAKAKIFDCQFSGKRFSLHFWQRFVIITPAQLCP
jgi:hypothetical protein